MLTGVFSIPVTALHDPPALLRVREVKDWYVDYLAGMLLEDKSDHEDLTAPLLVIASVEKDKFQEKNISKYTYEVITEFRQYYIVYHIAGNFGKAFDLAKWQFCRESPKLKSANIISCTTELC